MLCGYIINRGVLALLLRVDALAGASIDLFEFCSLIGVACMSVMCAGVYLVAFARLP